jgi:hypothetical protein
MKKGINLGCKAKPKYVVKYGKTALLFVHLKNARDWAKSRPNKNIRIINIMTKKRLKKVVQ